jgi:spore photoproduct lyase
MTPERHLARVLVSREARGESLTSKILERLPRLPHHSEGEFPMEGSGLQKETLLLVNHKGAFLKPCPGTREYICCGYQILNVATNCPMDCSYCILQTYFNAPGIRVFVNLEERLDQVLASIDAEPNRIFRVGTGEFTDSLAFDPLVGWTDLLIPRFTERKNAILEFKTKTDCVDGLLRSEFRDRIVVSWSLNSPHIVSREEHGAPSIRKRLEAARRCQSEGFVLGFHFDPLVLHEGWREGYLRTLECMEEYIDPKGVIWISMGSFRFMPGLKTIIRKRHPGTCLLDGEFVPGLDGKLRYFKPLRMELYGTMKEYLHSWHKDLPLYLCMESDEVWKKSMDWSPKDSSGLSRYLDAQVVNFFG